MIRQSRAASSPTVWVVLIVLAVAHSLNAQFSAYGTWTLPANTSPAFTVRGASGLPDEIAYFDLTTVPPTLVTLSGATGSLLPTSASPAMGTIGVIESGDFDGDGLVDIVAATPTQYSVYRRTATGFVLAFGPFNLLLPPAPDPLLHVVDRDNDGDRDIFIRNQWIANTGSGAFANPVAFTSAPAVRDTYFADVDRDGYEDTFATNYIDIFVVGTLPDGATAVPLNLFWDISMTARIFWRVLDIDADGIQDIWWIDRSVAPAFSIFVRGLGGGSFAAPVTRAVPATLAAAGIQSFVGADIDRDGRDEVVATVVQPTVGATTVYAIDATGALVPFPSSGPTITGLGNLATGDIDGDGRDDLFGVVAGATPTLSVFRSTAALRPMSINIVAGAGQTITALDPTTVPVVVEVFDNVVGAPAPGVPVLISADAGLSVSTIVGPTTDSLGRIQFSVSGNFVTGRKAVHLCLADGTSANVPFLVVPPATLSLVSGGGSYAYIGASPLNPVVIGATRLNGTPWIGGTVTLSATPNSVLPAGSNPATTDGLGQVGVTPSLSAPGFATLSARIGIGGRSPRTVATVAGRRFQVLHASGTSGLTILYNHEDGPTPLLIAADLPRTPIATPFGQIDTSVLAPQPGLVAIDGLGYFGPANPTVVANPNYTFFTFGVPPTIFGLTMVFQAYGLDFDYPLPQAVIVTPSVTVTL